MSDDEFIVGRVNLNGGPDGVSKPVIEIPLQTGHGFRTNTLLLLKILGRSNKSYGPLAYDDEEGWVAEWNHDTAKDTAEKSGDDGE